MSKGKEYENTFCVTLTHCRNCHITTRSARINAVERMQIWEQASTCVIYTTHIKSDTLCDVKWRCFCHSPPQIYTNVDS
jgi:hypothetical protein